VLVMIFLVVGILCGILSKQVGVGIGIAAGGFCHGDRLPCLDCVGEQLNSGLCYLYLLVKSGKIQDWVGLLL
jgi:hypothetical protein